MMGRNAFILAFLNQVRPMSVPSDFFVFSNLATFDVIRSRIRFRDGDTQYDKAHGQSRSRYTPEEPVQGLCSMLAYRL